MKAVLSVERVMVSWGFKEGVVAVCLGFRFCTLRSVPSKLLGRHAF